MRNVINENTSDGHYNPFSYGNGKIFLRHCGIIGQKKKKKTEQRDKRIVFYNRRKYAHSISTTDDKFCDFGTLDLNEKLFNYPSCPSHIHIHFFYYSIIKPLRQSDL